MVITKEKTHLLAPGFVTGKASQVHKAELVKDCCLKAIPCKKWYKKISFCVSVFSFFNKFSLTMCQFLSIEIILLVWTHLLPHGPLLSLQLCYPVKMCHPFFVCLSLLSWDVCLSHIQYLFPFSSLPLISLSFSFFSVFDCCGYDHFSSMLWDCLTRHPLNEPKKTPSSKSRIKN